MTVLIVLIIVFLIFPVFLYPIFNKAGFNGIFSVIPFYNYFIWLKIIDKPLWWYLFIIFPYLNIFMVFLMIVETVKAFGKHDLGNQALSVLFPFIFLPYIGISTKEKYLEPGKRVKIKKSSMREWVDAIIFAVVAATIIRTFIFEAYTIPTSSMEKSLLVGDYLFVSKISFGPKIPNTPIAFPFVHHTLPLTKYTRSFVEWIKLPFYRFPGFKSVRNNDVVVFNYPSGDTVVLQRQNEDYYQIIRDAEKEEQSKLGGHYKPGMGRAKIWSEYKIDARPVDKRENYIKRCIAVAGDSLLIIDKQVYVNGKPAANPPEMQFNYTIITDGTPFNMETFDKLRITEGIMISQNEYILPLSGEKAGALKNLPIVQSVTLRVRPAGTLYDPIFPHDPEHFSWNEDNFGPLWIPKAGVTIAINSSNIALYRKIIDVYENNDLKIQGDSIFINDKLSTSYTFKQDYYWMMGDNRDNSADSRFWGFVPYDHIVGEASFVWLSLEKNKSLFSGKIRWDKMFRVIR